MNQRVNRLRRVEIGNLRVAIHPKRQLLKQVMCGVRHNPFVFSAYFAGERI